MSQEQLNMGEIETQMYQQSIQNQLDTLMGISKGTETTLANSPSIMDTIGQALPLAGDVGGAISQGLGLPNSNILSIIGNL